jgi:DNA-directed RNA polymerase specialized sigma24 family protein
VIAIRLGTDTAESRMPDAGDCEDALLGRDPREERSGRDSLDDGKKHRFESLALQHLDAAYNLARWLVRNDEDANDIVQDAYLRAMRAFDGFRGGNARPWLLANLPEAAARNRRVRLARWQRRLRSIGPHAQPSGIQRGAVERGRDELLRRVGRRVGRSATLEGPDSNHVDPERRRHERRDSEGPAERPRSDRRSFSSAIRRIATRTIAPIHPYPGR